MGFVLSILSPSQWNSLYRIVFDNDKNPYLIYTINVRCKNLNPVKLSKKQLNLYNKICELEWIEFFNLGNNNLCPPYPDCGDGPITSEDEQDISECPPLSILESTLPIHYNLYQPFPNPFNPTTTLSFSIPEQSQTSLKVYDIKGNLISTLLNESMNVGYHQIEWNAEGYPSGVYFVKLDAGEFTQTQKLFLVK